MLVGKVTTHYQSFNALFLALIRICSLLWDIRSVENNSTCGINEQHKCVENNSTEHNSVSGKSLFHFKQLIHFQ